jgi:hypothetical protein
MKKWLRRFNGQKIHLTAIVSRQVRVRVED